MIKRILLALIIICTLQGVTAQRLSTTFTNDLTRWRFDGQTFKTVFSNDLSRWTFNGVQIKSTFSNNYN